MSTISGFPTADAIKNTASFAKNLGGRTGKDIHATQMVGSMSGSNHGTY